MACIFISLYLSYTLRWSLERVLKQSKNWKDVSNLLNY